MVIVAQKLGRSIQMAQLYFQIAQFKQQRSQALVHRAHKVFKVLLALKVNKVLLVRKVFKGIKAFKALQVLHQQFISLKPMLMRLILYQVVLPKMFVDTVL